MIHDALSDPTRTRFFTSAATHTEWIGWLDRKWLSGQPLQSWIRRHLRAGCFNWPNGLLGISRATAQTNSFISLLGATSKCIVNFGLL